MTRHDWCKMIEVFCATLNMIWYLGSNTNNQSSRRVIQAWHWFFQEVHPFMPGVFVVWYVASVVKAGETFQPSLGFWLGLNLLMWWLINRDKKDDRWKRRRKKLKEKVARVGTKLVVVPARG